MRRDLGLSVEATEALPWWQARMYEEGVVGAYVDLTRWRIAVCSGLGVEYEPEGREADRVTDDLGALGVRVEAG